MWQHILVSDQMSNSGDARVAEAACLSLGTSPRGGFNLRCVNEQRGACTKSTKMQSNR